MASGCSSSQSDSLLHASIVLLWDLVITITHQRASHATFQSFTPRTDYHEVSHRRPDKTVIFGGKY